jgi:hypothetical protein
MSRRSPHVPNGASSKLQGDKAGDGFEKEAVLRTLAAVQLCAHVQREVADSNTAFVSYLLILLHGRASSHAGNLLVHSTLHAQVQSP